MVIGDIIGLIAALAAFDEEQQSKEETRHEIENKIRYLQDKARGLSPLRKVTNSTF